MKLSPSPQEAWQPLPETAWNEDAARHLLRRAGWTATPAEVARASRDGLAGTVARLFPAAPARLPMPKLTERLQDASEAYRGKVAAAPPEEKRMLQREERERSRDALLDLSIRWLEFAANPENSAFQKWVLFLGDVYVVSFDKVPRTQLLYRHFDAIAEHALGPAPLLAKAMSRSPAMLVYLDLNQNRKDAPNENFARELFELFLLGEGNYTEKDIKESARAFTGYRLRPPAEFFFARNQHDFGRKTIFGRSGNFDGDDVIDLAFGLPAAGAFLPHEMVKFYLSDEMIPREHLASLGEEWRAQGYGLRWLATRFFSSRLFFEPQFRGDFIKSPVQYYLGLLQDLGLDVLPVPRMVVNPLRQMGQVLFNPPNVRGWVGGRNWINSASLAARRTLVETLFNPMREDALTADEQLDVIAAREAGADTFTVTDDRLSPIAALKPPAAAASILASFLAVHPGAEFQDALQAFIADGRNPKDHLRRLRRSIVTALESPEYQLC